ncbi:MAG: DUF1013 domain-containing protein [Rhodospirillaceae bacterium]|jgi:hypothetical protein|nr:DUF1013 domain-containing protein [Rhodospirillaceae bacterium]
MILPLMPKATAVWLIENSALSFEQISVFCGMHVLEIQAIANDEVAVGIIGFDPVINGQLTREEIERCEKDKSANLRLSNSLDLVSKKTRGARYISVSKRQNKPDAIAWILKHHPELSDPQVCKLIGTTKDTISKVRDRNRRTVVNAKPCNPMTLGLCSESDLKNAIIIAKLRNINL